jgi:hypothetical protein
VVNKRDESPSGINELEGIIGCDLDLKKSRKVFRISFESIKHLLKTNTI